MNTLTIAELKRRGMAAIEEGLEKGPIHIMKRNRPSAVIVTEADYLLIQAAQRGASTEKKPSDEGMTAMEWLLALKPQGSRSGEEILSELKAERDSWEDRLFWEKE